MEYLGLYDENGKYTGEKVARSEKEQISCGKYFRVTIIFIQNSKGEFLIQKVSQAKGNVYATTGGHVQNGVSSLETIKQEVFEELGLLLNIDDINLFAIEKRPHVFHDSYYTKIDVAVDELKLQLEEVASVEWMTVEKINDLIEQNLFRKGNIRPFNDLLEILKSGQNFDKVIYRTVDV